ncbi:MAG: helix-turn-helix transcriptional regulator, partial [Saprospiraceae bacterium]
MPSDSLHSNSDPERTPGTAGNRFLKKVTAQVDAHYGDPAFGIKELAEALELSLSQLYRKIKALTGRSPAIYLRSLRLLKAKDLLMRTELSITEIAHKTGFSKLTYFSYTFS